MSRQNQTAWVIFLIGLTVFTGCTPTQPFYLGGKDDLAHYLDVATEIDYPDVENCSLDEVMNAAEPLTLSRPEPKEMWDLSLEDAVQISMQNSKVLKTIGGSITTPFSAGAVNASPAFAQPSQQLRQLATSVDAVPTIYGPSLQETNVLSPNTQGVESALAEFDAQFTTGVFWDKISRPQNSLPNPFFPPIQIGDRGDFTAQLAKKSATGTQFFFRNNTDYELSNAGNRAVPSDWFTNFEMEARQPLLRGAGTQINRIPVVLARLRTDVSLADFERNVRDHVYNVETAYWELYFSYRNLQARKAARDSVHALWRNITVQVPGNKTLQEEAQARQQYFQERARVEGALGDLFKAENRLRYLMGIAPTDGRLIRPIDEPMNARICFDWHDVLGEALCRNAEVRIKRWNIQQREMELIAARNLLLPQLDVVGLYRWLGRGDDLWNEDGGSTFPYAGPPQNTSAMAQLFSGDFQEWRMGVEMTLPVGFRRELAGVRHAQLQLAREHAVLEETELEVVHQLTDSIQNVDGWYELAQTNFNRRAAAEAEVQTLQAAYESGVGEGSTTLNLLLDALTRRADSQALFFRNLSSYTESVAELHKYKGSLLEYNNIMLAEGPWPHKAYYDAWQAARRRSASHYLDYGYTRPRVISRGRYEQFQHGSVDGQDMMMEGEAMEGVPMPYVPAEGEEIPAPQPLPGQTQSVMQYQVTSAPAPTPPAAASTVRPASQTTGGATVRMRAPSSQPANNTGASRTSPQTAVQAAAVRPATATANGGSGSVTMRVKNSEQFDWGPVANAASQ